MKNNPFANKQEQKDTGPDLKNIVNQTTQANRRLRLLEDRYKTLHQKVQLTDENMLKSHRKIHKELRAYKKEIEDIKHSLSKLNENIGLIISDLKKCARIDDVKTLQKYLDYWKPAKFVTQNQVERIVKDMLDK
ncbi:MAG: hypothetical protein MAG795_00880 [Candidatus Woesearchaeota archaeon]|nr:hypothetical protein [Candidatus Woesearchaeota archaeon]